MIIPSLLLSIALNLITFITATEHISPGLYEDFVHYFRYASSAYAHFCPKPNGQTAIKRFHDFFTDARGFVARDDTRKDIVLSFAGSATFLDTITDAQIFLRPFNTPGVYPPNGTLVHRGFLEAWNSVASIVLDAVELQLKVHTGYKLVSVGHSMGGAVASLAAISLKLKFPFDDVYLYTYGQPRTGNDVYAYWVNEELREHVFRVVHTTDWVPNVISRIVIPFYSEDLGQETFSDSTSSFVERRYRHHGIEYWQNPDPPSANTTVRCSIDGEDPKCSNSLFVTSALAHMSYFGIIATWPFCL